MSRLPSLFISHGAPTFALSPGTAGAQLSVLGRRLPRPRAVLVVSPHWLTVAPKVTATTAPETIYDFGGFDPALYDLRYPAPGDPQLAQHVVTLLRRAGWPAALDARRGLDHGVWVPLLHLYPQADVPVLQLSMPARLTGESAYRLGQALAPLADDGVLIVGSGSLTHNLYELHAEDSAAVAYASEFTRWIREAVARGDHDALQRALGIAPHGQRAHPTPEHYWPLPIAAGAAAPGGDTTSIDGGIRYGVLAMDSFVFGAVPAAAASAAANAA